MGETYAAHKVGAAEGGPAENDLLFRNLARLAADAIVLADERGTITFWNRSAQNLFGYPSIEIVGRPLTVIMPSRYRERHQQGLLHHRSTGESTYFGSVHEYHGLRKDGTEFPADIAVSSWRADGRTVFAGMIRDTTQRTEAARILQESRERYRSLFDASPDAVTLTDLDFRILMCNAQKVQLYGYENAAELIGKSALELIAAADRPRARQMGGDILREGVVRNVELSMLRKDGSTFPAEMSGSLILGPDGQPHALTAVVRNITDRKSAEDGLRASEQHYQKLFHQAHDMEQSIRKLSQKAIHVQEDERRRVSRELHDEVGQALTAISVNLESVKRGLDSGSPARKRLIDAQNLVGQTVRNLQRVCHELHPAILEHLGLIAALRWYAKTFSERTGVMVRLKVRGDPGVLAPDQRLMVYRIVQEGLTNTLKHAKAKQATIEMIGRPGQVSLSIHDDGKGFRVGRELSTSHHREGLGGLGLLGIQERIRLAGGSFEVESQRGKGTTIRIEVAVHATREKARRRARKTSE